MITKLFSFIVLFISAGVCACSCGKGNNLAEDHNEADVIFVGTLKSKSLFYSFTKNEFEYVGLSFYKGAAEEPLHIVTNKNSSSCGLEYFRGEKYVIYAYKDREDGRLRTSRCSSWPISSDNEKKNQEFFVFYKRNDKKNK